jgi:hypothetical protein
MNAVTMWTGPVAFLRAYGLTDNRLSDQYPIDLSHKNPSGG